MNTAYHFIRNLPNVFVAVAAAFALKTTERSTTTAVALMLGVVNLPIELKISRICYIIMIHKIFLC